MKKSTLAALLILSLSLTACASQKDKFALVEASESSESLDVRTETRLEEQDFKVYTKVDKTLKNGETKILQKGRRGQSRVAYEVTYRDGVEISRRAISEKILQSVQDAIIAIGDDGSNKEDGTTEDLGTISKMEKSSKLRGLVNNQSLEEKPSVSRPAQPPAAAVSPSSASSSAPSATSSSSDSGATIVPPATESGSQEEASSGNLPVIPEPPNTSESKPEESVSVPTDPKEPEKPAPPSDPPSDSSTNPPNETGKSESN